MSHAIRAVQALERRCNVLDLGLQQVMDAVTLDDAKRRARQAIREAYFGYVEDDPRGLNQGKALP